MNDLQIPFEDKQVLWGLVLPFVKELRPHGIVINGDGIDNYEISDYSKDPAKRGFDLKAERKGAARLMDYLRPHCVEAWWIEGNHEDRYLRYVWSRVPELAAAQGMPTFASFFELEKHGFQHKHYGEHLMLGKLLVTHGFLVAQASGVSAKRHFERLGTSVLGRPERAPLLGWSERVAAGPWYSGGTFAFPDSGERCASATQEASTRFPCRS